MNLPRWSIIREEEFEQQLESLLVNWEEADEFTAAAEAILAADPEIGMPASADRWVWTLPLPLVRGRQVTLYYSFDKQAVHLLGILPFD